MSDTTPQLDDDGNPIEPEPVNTGLTDLNQINYFAAANYRNENRKFGIKTDDRRRHMYLIGKTGMGKSTVQENMIIQDIRNGNGLAVVDPHGDLVEKVIRFIPPHRINDVIYFNPSDLEHPIAFNILESVNPEHKNLVSNGLVGVFKKIWADSWGPRLEYILINAILALIEYPGSTLLGVTRMLVDPKYRKKVVRNISDPVVKSFWVNEYNNYTEKFRNEAIAPIQNKVGQFLSSSLIRNIVGQSHSSMDMREVMDDGKILLMNLSKGRIGEENAALLGAMMITKIQLAAMSRVDIMEDQRRDFFLYVDEFQNFSTESFAGILSEARKYRLDLILAHQYVEQLSDEVKAAVFGNVGTMVAFRVGATDAEELEKEFQPTFMIDDLVNLPAYHTYMRLMIDGVASEPFSATTLPPLSGETGNAEKVINVSRERYARNRVEIEQAIARWSGMEDQMSDSERDGDDDSDDNETTSAKADYKEPAEAGDAIEPVATPVRNHPRVTPGAPPRPTATPPPPPPPPVVTPVAAPQPQPAAPAPVVVEPAPVAPAPVPAPADELHELKYKGLSFVQSGPAEPAPPVVVEPAPTVSPQSAPAAAVSPTPAAAPAPAQPIAAQPQTPRPPQRREQAPAQPAPQPQPQPRPAVQPSPTRPTQPLKPTVQAAASPAVGRSNIQQALPQGPTPRHKAPKPVADTPEPQQRSDNQPSGRQPVTDLVQPTNSDAAGKKKRRRRRKKKDGGGGDQSSPSRPTEPRSEQSTRVQPPATRPAQPQQSPGQPKGRPRRSGQNRQSSSAQPLKPGQAIHFDD